MSYKIYLLGLIYNHVCTEGERFVLLPRGSNPPLNLPEHVASLFLNKDQVSSADWWPGYSTTHVLNVPSPAAAGKAHPSQTEYKVMEFRFPEHAVVLFSGAADSPLDTTSLEKNIPKLQDDDASFYVDPSDVDTIADVPLRGGRMKFFRIQDAGVIEWAITTKKNASITTIVGREAKTITLERRNDIEIVLSNTPNFIKGPHPAEVTDSHDGMHEEGVHFSLYGRLNKSRDGSKLKDPTIPPPVQKLKANHGYVKYLEKLVGWQVPGTNCTPSCC